MDYFIPGMEMARFFMIEKVFFLYLLYPPSSPYFFYTFSSLWILYVITLL